MVGVSILKKLIIIFIYDMTTKLLANGSSNALVREDKINKAKSKYHLEKKFRIIRQIDGSQIIFLMPYIWLF